MLATKVLRTTVSKTGLRAMSGKAFWGHVEMGPKDPILGVSEAFQASTAPHKINVGVGAYRGDDGKPWVLPSVQEAQKRIIDQNLNMEYAPISGVPEFVAEAKKLAYGENSDALQNNRVAAVQSLSGTGALRLAGQLFAQQAEGGVKPTVLLPNPTWGNHFPIFQHSGLQTQTYRYFDPKTKGLDLDGMLEDINNFEGKAVVLLHACAHNPTGVDPNAEQWAKISEACLKKGHFVLFDNAYQGFASGDTERDVASVHQFIADGHNIALCQSFAKNFGLYGQRVGQFSVLCADADEQARLDSQIKMIARAIYSNPPVHGARIVSTILKDPELKGMWQDEIRQMSGRINKMRVLLKDNIIKAGSKHNWDHITNQIGMFSFTGATKEQCEAMTKNHEVYLTSNGRISMAGVTTGNVEHLANALHEATK